MIQIHPLGSVSASAGRLRRLNRRQRKKLRLGEFQEFTFEVQVQFHEPLDEVAYDLFLDSFLEFVEVRLLAFGGMSWRLPQTKIDGVISAWGHGSPTDDDRQSVLAWLQERPEIALAKVEELCNAGVSSVGPLSFDQVAATKSATALKGLVRKPASPVTIGAMNAAIAGRGKKP